MDTYLLRGGLVKFSIIPAKQFLVWEILRNWRGRSSTASQRCPRGVRIESLTQGTPKVFIKMMMSKYWTIVGGKSKQKLMRAKITCIGNLKRNNQPVPSISESSLQFLKDQTQLAKDEDTPPKVDHHKAPSPYLSRYGANWEAHLKKSSYFSSDVVITDLYWTHQQRIKKSNGRYTIWKQLVFL